MQCSAQMVPESGAFDRDAVERGGVPAVTTFLLISQTMLQFPEP